MTDQEIQAIRWALARHLEGMREALQAEHQPHAAWVGCPTCAILAAIEKEEEETK